jgi:hypothetical protein
MERETELLKQAVSEIRMLRSQNQLMSARLEMFDSLMLVLHTDVARRGQGMSPDLTWEIEKFLEKENQNVKIAKD